MDIFMSTKIDSVDMKPCLRQLCVCVRYAEDIKDEPSAAAKHPNAHPFRHRPLSNSDSDIQHKLLLNHNNWNGMRKSICVQFGISVCQSNSKNKRINSKSIEFRCPLSHRNVNNHGRWCQMLAPCAVYHMYDSIGEAKIAHRDSITLLHGAWQIYCCRLCALGVHANYHNYSSSSRFIISWFCIICLDCVLLCLFVCLLIRIYT